MATVLKTTEKYQIGPFAPIQIFKAKSSGLTNPLDGKRQTAIVNRLATQFHKLDKAKLRVLKEIDHEKKLWTRHLQSLTAGVDGTSYAETTHNYTSADLIETDDGKVVPPGFRFKSNGEIRIPSQTLQALQKIATQADVRREEDEKSAADEQAPGSVYSDEDDEDYEKEIQRLENAIFRICQSLRLGKVHLYQEPLRHQNVTRNVTAQDFDYSEPVGDSSANDDTASPTSKSPQQAPRGSFNPIRPRMKICIGCNMKLRNACTHQIKHSLQRAHGFDAKQRRWSYVPRGRYVQPSLLNRRRDKQDPWNEPQEETRPATQPSKKRTLYGMEQPDSGKKLPSLGYHSAMSKHDSSKTSIMPSSLKSKSQTTKLASTKAQTTKQATTKSQKPKSARFAPGIPTPKPPSDESFSELHVSSLGQVLSSTRATPAAVAAKRKPSKESSGRFDHETFNRLMKVAQVEEQDMCDKKVKIFLRSLPPVKRYFD